MSHDPDHADYEGSIIIAREILPSQLFKLASQRAAGMILLSGNLTSHVSILARSLRIPTLLIDDPMLLERGEGLSLILDAVQGNLLINPDAEVLASYRTLIEERQRLEALEPTVHPSTRTRDGTPVRLYANINLLSDLRQAKRLKAEGIGLYRSEIPFIVRDSFPSEEEQYRIYRRLVEEMEGHSVTLRTLDIGGDKMLSYMPNANEANPFLGLRAIRFSLRNRAVFAQQLKAMLRAGAGANIRIMFPLISSVDEYLHACDVVRSCVKELADEGIPHNAKPALGMMIELPSAVELIEELCYEADFVSIGTNDLIQYLLAVDRTNELISDLYLPYHPAVLRALFKIGDAARRHGIDVSVCGDLATDLRLIPFLLGCGIHTLSIDARYIPAVQKVIENTDMAQARKGALDLLKLSRISEVAAFLGISSSGN
jgi:phosphotransferase system enzyme I (PtsP)